MGYLLLGSAYEGSEDNAMDATHHDDDHDDEDGNDPEETELRDPLTSKIGVM